MAALSDEQKAKLKAALGGDTTELAEKSESPMPVVKPAGPSLLGVCWPRREIDWVFIRRLTCAAVPGYSWFVCPYIADQLNMMAGLAGDTAAANAAKSEEIKKATTRQRRKSRDLGNTHESPHAHAQSKGWTSGTLPSGASSSSLSCSLRLSRPWWIDRIYICSAQHHTPRRARGVRHAHH